MSRFLATAKISSHCKAICCTPEPESPTRKRSVEDSRECEVLIGNCTLCSAFTKDLVLSLEVPQKERSKTVAAKQRAAEAIEKMKGLIAQAA